MVFLPRSGVVEGPLAAFGSSDGVIRVLSMTLWQVIIFPKSCQLRPFFAPGSGSPFQNISEIVKSRMHTEVAYFSRAERARIFVRRGKASPNMKVVVQLVRRYISGHKGPVSCLLTFLASSGEVLLAFPHYFLLMLFRRFLLTGVHRRSSHGEGCLED